MAEKVVTKILKEAEKKSKSIVDEARSDSEEVIKAASLQAERILKDAKELSAEKAREEKERVLASANLEIRKAMLEQKQKLMDEAFKSAVNHLRQKSKKEYVALIERLLVQSVETGAEEVIVGKADKDIIDSKVIASANKKLRDRGNLTLSKTVGSMTGGFILRRGKVDVNLSFDGLIELARESLESEVAKILFRE
jgi:V/A-type H+-transporting ATPase subunit E